MTNRNSASRRTAAKLTSQSRVSRGSKPIWDHMRRTMKLKRFPDVKFNEINENFVHNWRIQHFISPLKRQTELRCTWSPQSSRHLSSSSPVSSRRVAAVSGLMSFRSHETMTHCCIAWSRRISEVIFFFIIVLEKRVDNWYINRKYAACMVEFTNRCHTKDATFYSLKIRVVDVLLCCGQSSHETSHHRSARNFSLSVSIIISWISSFRH